MPRKTYEELDERAPLKFRDRMIVAAVESGELSKRKAAEKFGVSRTTVNYIFKRVKKAEPLIEAYKAARSDVLVLNQIELDKVQKTIVDAWDEKTLKSAKLRDQATVFNVVGLQKSREYEQERLETGQSTENVAVIVQAIKDAKRRLELE
jgi:hypothetical protein